MGFGQLTSHKPDNGQEQTFAGAGVEKVSTNPYDYGFKGPEDFDMSKVGGIMAQNPESEGWSGGKSSGGSMPMAGTNSIGMGDIASAGNKKQTGSNLATKGVKQLIKAYNTPSTVTGADSAASASDALNGVDTLGDADTIEEADSILGFL